MSASLRVAVVTGLVDVVVRFGSWQVAPWLVRRVGVTIVAAGNRHGLGDIGPERAVVETLECAFRLDQVSLDGVEVVGIHGPESIGRAAADQPVARAVQNVERFSEPGVDSVMWM